MTVAVAGPGTRACTVDAAAAGTAAVTLTGAASVAVAELGIGAANAGAACTLVTIACAAIDAVRSWSADGRSISESTTAAPAVAPMAVATNTTRTVRMKLGAGARYPHSELKLPAERIAVSRQYEQWSHPNI